MTAQAGDTPSVRAALRRRARQARRSLSPAEHRRASVRACLHALRLAERLRLRHCALYAAYGDELDTQPLIRALQRRGVAVYLPVIHRPGQMHFQRWRGGALRPGVLGILRPAAGARRHAVALDALFMPLIAFDAHGSRLGVGGGYYDRYLAHLTGRRRPLRIGLAFDVQRSATPLPTQPWDVPLHRIVTESGILRPAAGHQPASPITGRLECPTG